jgi:hypothetical protein
VPLPSNPLITRPNHGKNLDSDLAQHQRYLRTADQLGEANRGNPRGDHFSRIRRKGVGGSLMVERARAMLAH